MNLPLKERLKKAASLVGPTATLDHTRLYPDAKDSPRVVAADVGCDHAYLSCYLVLSGICQTVIASDVRSGPLEAAKQNIKRFGCETRVETLLTDGLDGIGKYQPTDIVICGMGGDTIQSILEKAPFVKTKGMRLILQPMTGEAELAIYLAANGFRIAAQRYAEEGAKVYRLLAAEYDGVSREINTVEALLGTRACLEDCSAYAAYCRKTAGRVYKKIHGAGSCPALERLARDITQKGLCDTCQTKTERTINMVTAKELFAHLNAVYPTALSCSWDNDGAMCMSDPEREVKRVLLALDITSEAVQYAVDNGFDVIVSHHPLIFTPMRSINGCDVKSRVITKLMRSGISAFSFHTRLDAVSGGVNDCLAETLGLLDVAPFPSEKEPLGRIGRLPTPLSGRELAAFVKEKLLCDSLSFTNPEKTVEKVVLVGGAGKDFIDAALDSFADAFITGEVSYNAAIDAADSGLCLIMAGHFFTENPVLTAIERQITRLNPAIETACFNSNLIHQI